MATETTNALNNKNRGLPVNRVEPPQRALGPKDLELLKRELGPRDGRGKVDPRAFERKIYRFSKPDGSAYEVEFGNGTYNPLSQAQAWGRIVGDRFVSERLIPRQEAPSTTLEIEPPPPRVVEIDRIKPKERAKPVKTIEKAKPIKAKPSRKEPEPLPASPSQVVPPPAKPKKRSEPIPPQKPEKYTVLDYIKDGSFAKTTFDESLPLAAKWLRRAAKVMEYVPPLKPAAKYYELMAEGLDGASLIYDLSVELSQEEALEKGSKELVKRVKPVKQVALKLIKRKFPNVPEPLAKKMAEELEELFEKNLTDPEIKKLKEKMKEQDKGKELEKSLWDQLKKSVSPTPTLQ